MKAATKATALQGHAAAFPKVKPWPEPVDGAQVLSEIADTVAKYVALPNGAADAIALWTAHAHAFKLFPHSPRLNIRSPEKRCGKSTLRDVIATLVPKPLPTENLTTAVLFRVIDKHQPTILADEYDTWLTGNEDLRGVLNAGHNRGGTVLRCAGDDHDVRGFNAFAPAVLVGIGSLTGTLYDRSIVIRLARAKRGEVKGRFDSRRIKAETDLCRRLARWCADHAKQIENSDPLLPADAFNRVTDNWRPLFAIAEVAGGEWPQRAARAFALLTAQDDDDAHGIGTILLADIRTLFSEAATDRMFSKTLVDSLVAMADRPWGEAHKGKEINENWLAHQLRGFGISPKTLRIGAERAKGYEREQFADAFERYLPSLSPLSDRDTVTSPENIGSDLPSQAVTSSVTCNQQTVTPTPVTAQESFVTSRVTVQDAHEAPANTALSRCHASNPPTLEV